VRILSGLAVVNEFSELINGKCNAGALKDEGVKKMMNAE
jgi:hypothetical protein